MPPFQGDKGGEKGKKKGKEKGGEKGGSKQQQQQQQQQSPNDGSFGASLSREYPELHRRLWSTNNREEHLRLGHRIAAKSRPRPISNNNSRSSSSGTTTGLPGWASPAEREAYLWDCLEVEEGLLHEIAAQEKAERERWRVASENTDEADRWRQWQQVCREVSGQQPQPEEEHQQEQQQHQPRQQKYSRKRR